MSSSPDTSANDGPLIETDLDATYSLEVMARLTGASSETILFYHEQGLVPAVKTTGAEEHYFDDEALRAIRRLEHLRHELQLKEPALKLMVNLLTEMERLRDAARGKR
jgi:DNA-binding transcriptional MerR regulator